MMQRHRSSWLIGLLLMPAAVAAQGVRGVVSARQTGEPIASALVQLVSRDSTVLASAFTDEAGRFALATDSCGPADGHLYVARLGYDALRAAIRDLPADCAEWAIALETNPVQLPALPVRVTRNPALERVGFYGRQRIGLGTFITRATIEERYPTANRASELIRQVPGIFRVDEADNESVIYVRLHPAFSGPCPASFWVDGLPFQKRLPRIPAQDVEAIEIYRGAAQVPAQYGGANSACGVIVIWTRTGAGGTSRSS